MIKVQVSVTPNEAKRLIALGIAGMLPVRSALEKGKIFLRGGSTVSAVAQVLGSVTLGLSGRITQQGTKTAGAESDLKRGFFDAGVMKNVDSDEVLDGYAVRMGKDDILITGANALDVHRKAAIMVGHPMGGPAARVLPALMARGLITIIAVGWEKLIPGTIEEACAAAGRESVDLAMGMAVGLVPLYGTVVTETDAINLLTGTRCTVIGAGGIMGGEGSTTFVIDGEREQVRKAWDLVNGVKGSGPSVLAESLKECYAKCHTCSRFVQFGGVKTPLHRACAYLQPGLVKKVLGSMLVTPNQKWDDSAEIVIAGFGGAGAVAAITARDAGGDVLILEKQLEEAHYTGTGMAGGFVLSPVSPADAFAYVERLYREGEAASWIEDRALFQTWSSYVCQNKAWLEKTLNTSMILEGAIPEARLPGWESMTAYQFRGRGYMLFAGLKEAVRQRKIPVVYRTSVTDLLTDLGGRVMGVRAEKTLADGRTQKVDIRSGKAVILTCGGFEYNEAIKRHYLQVYPYFSHGTPAATGAGIRMALQAGADLWHMAFCSGRWMLKYPDFPIAFHIDIAGRGWRMRGHRIGQDSPAPAGYIVVDQSGRRYTSENAKAHSSAYEMALYDSQRLRQPRIPSYWIFDQRRIEVGPLVNVAGGAAGPYRLYEWSRDNRREIEKGWIIQADSLKDLARNLDTDIENLEKTVSRYNGFCAAGEDAEFSRDPLSLVPLDTPSFYAARLYPAGITHGGPRRNGRAEILNLDGEPIHGLFGAGELGSIHGRLCIGGGSFLGECIVFGRLAGENAVRQK